MWGYVVIDYIVCDMMKSKCSLCIRMCMLKIIFVHVHVLGIWIDFDWCDIILGWIYWCASVKPDQMLTWYITVPDVFACDVLNCYTAVYIVCCVMCLECLMVCCSVFADTCPVDCGNSYLLYGAAFVLVLCGSPLTVTWG